jgi:hypothetical protein
VQNFSHQGFRAEGTSDDARPQTVDIEMGRILLIVFQILDEHRGNSVQRSAFVLRDRLQSFLGVEPFSDNSNSCSSGEGS